MKFLRSTSPLTLSVSRPGRRSHLGVGGSEMYRRVFALLLFLFTTAGAITTETGKTVITPPPLALMLEPVSFQLRDFAARNPVADRFTFTAAPFYLESTNPKDLRKAFMPEGKDELRIKGSEAGACDVSATWLKVVGTSAVGANHQLMHNGFSSRLTVEPRYSMYGTMLGLHKQVGIVFVQATMPLAEVQTNLGLKETIEGGNVGSLDDLDVLYRPNGANVAGIRENTNILYSVSAAEALGQPYRTYNKLSSSPLKASGIGDVALRVGLAGEFGELFVSGVLPTSKRLTNAYLFEPMVGNGSHLGLGVGGALKLGKHLDALNAQLSLRGEFDYTYLFENDQVRTFDLADRGQLSRYLIFRHIDAAAGGGDMTWYPGVNVLSKKCAVSPQGVVHAGLQAGMQRGKIVGKLHYQFTHQQQESIRVKEGFGEDYDAGHTSGIDNTPINRIDIFYHNAKVATHGDEQIAAGLRNAGSPVAIDRLDLASATRPAASISSGIVSIGFEDTWHGAMAGVGLLSGINFDHGPQRLCSWMLGVQSTVNF